MFSGYYGGNCWICSGYMILTFDKKSGEVKDITPRPFNKVWTPMDTKDLNKNGIPELLILDGRLEMIDGLSHAGSPYSKIVYGWSKKKGKYVHKARFFGDFYERKIKEALQVVRKSYSEEHKYEFIKSWFELLLHLKHSSSSPWKEFKEYWNKYSEENFPYSLENIRIGMERSGIIISGPEDNNEES